MEFIVAFILLHRIRAALYLEADKQKWYKIITYGLVACGVLLVMKATPVVGPVIHWIGFIFLFYLFWLIYREPVLQPVRFIMVSLLPYVAVAVASEFTALVAPGFHDNYSALFKTAKAFGIIWMVGSFILYRKQRKALAEERKLREEEARLNKINVARKAELELLVRDRTIELSEQNEKLKNALEDLSATQTQLIHSEKMASLGQLMAGIAHEIKNPLNFVNNFADLNTELTHELMQAVEQDDKEEALSLAAAIRENEEKIAHHGKRADSIVRSMLQHSRSGSGKRELMDINALADECIRLSYHGMRARVKSFNAKIETKFDPEVGEIEVIPDEINRVILNICTNSLYAVNERSKLDAEDYHPTISIKTKAFPEKVSISISDNGTGIPAEAIGKIFQPFFTTKPTGEGTGLGLSMSYDIVTKGHNGELNVESEEGKGTTFTIILPRNNTLT